jgi:hypothetical protein
VEIESDLTTTTGGTENCSAVLVTPTWLLTASHCVTAHGLGSACGIAEGSHLFDPTIPVHVWLSSIPSYFPDGSPAPPWDLEHNYSASGGVFSRQNFLDECSEASSARDLALIKLDTRIPISQIRPIHPALNGVVKCRDFVPDSSDFDAIVVGYGGTNIFSNSSLHRTSEGPRAGSCKRRTIVGASSPTKIAGSSASTMTGRTSAIRVAPSWPSARTASASSAASSAAAT